jgi:hypothetical protein
MMGTTAMLVGLAGIILVARRVYLRRCDEMYAALRSLCEFHHPEG